jgi:hypothetical protein
MWKESMDMFSFIRSKETLGGKLLSEVGQAGGRELTQALTEKLATTTLKNAGESLLREAGQSGLREISQSGLRETSQSSGKKLFSSTTKKISSAGSANLAQSTSKEFAQQATKQSGQSGASSFVKKAATVGILGGGVFAASKVKTDTNGDGVIDEKDKSLLQQGAGAVGEVAKEITTPILKAGMDVGGDLAGSLLEGLGIDMDALKEKFKEYLDYGKYFLYFILFIIAIKLLSMLYSGLKIIGIVGKTKPVTIIQSVTSQKPNE